NISDIIVIDFIDMKSSKHKQQIVAMLKQALAGDYVKISDISELGLVEMVRKYTGDSLEQVLSA
ncbi:ribonuclease E/G, partial [Thiotrichales bacterium HSG1]|nr:ribonuclease E/G [Thiotrichales bacterium HSG1]